MSEPTQFSGYPTVQFPGHQPWQPSRIAPAGPPNNMGWAVAAVLFFWPISFAAITAASRVDSAWLRGDAAFAMAESARAKKLGKRALIIAAVCYGVFILLYVAMIATLVSTSSSCISDGTC